ncbi:MAG: LacI family DNA-binding transcriptional regulator [Candidatus Sumerlaeota bacterium]|nr:LacI family DNA-binding transcriptional regulator [Candidatus Sumerlaeota bacterium]
MGSIGVLMTSHPPESVRSWGYSEADNWRLHAILRQAAERHYLQEVHCIPPGDQENLYSRIGGLFSKQVRGILSLRPFSIPDFDILPSDSLPIVFLGYYAFRDGPCVALDLETGFYRLTREVIRQGHRRILLIPKAYPMPSEMELIYKGFERAMVEAGLSVDREAYEAALRIEWADLRVVREHLAAFVDPKGPRQSQHATAVVSAHYNYALSAIAVADLMGIRVPSDLSVVGMISGPIRLEDPNQRLTGIEYDVDLMVRMGFEVLEEQMRTRRNSVSLVRVKPIIQHGDSLAPPRKD